MNKSLIIFSLCFIFNSLVYSQLKLKGDYTFSYGSVDNGEWQLYSFKKSGVFKFDTEGELGKVNYGKGHYYIKNDSLILNYDLTKLEYESYFKAKKYYNTKDSIAIKVKAINFNKEPLNNIGVYSFPNHQSSFTDKKGQALLKFKKGNYKDKIELYVEGAFLARQIIYLDSDTNYDLEVFMNKSQIIGFGHPKAIKNVKVKYKIIQNTDSILKLKRGNQILNLVKQKE